ncbi:hypothetical protein PFISCL1PPCAC_10951, partial [Pristionchus fissidentatus]
ASLNLVSDYHPMLYDVKDYRFLLFDHPNVERVVFEIHDWFEYKIAGMSSAAKNYLRFAKTSFADFYFATPKRRAIQFIGIYDKFVALSEETKEEIEKEYNRLPGLARWEPVVASLRKKYMQAN